ncbi:MAG: GHKL domain-containing protein, partial [Saprospiraceae bacterium]|nr:GHKL domain-containing protein [Saprospiraceae bacterium]
RTQIAGEAGTHIIEPMLMIPFVENAFKHGVGLVENPEIDIDLKIKGNELTFVIRNKISSESQESKDSSSGIGLQNVRRRLELLYPDNHRLDILQNEWFEIRLWLKLGHGPGN